MIMLFASFTNTSLPSSPASDIMVSLHNQLERSCSRGMISLEELRDIVHRDMDLVDYRDDHSIKTMTDTEIIQSILRKLTKHIEDTQSDWTKLANEIKDKKINKDLANKIMTEPEYVHGILFYEPTYAVLQKSISVLRQAIQLPTTKGSETIPFSEWFPQLVHICKPLIDIKHFMVKDRAPYFSTTGDDGRWLDGCWKKGKVIIQSNNYQGFSGLTFAKAGYTDQSKIKAAIHYVHAVTTDRSLITLITDCLKHIAILSKVKQGGILGFLKQPDSDPEKRKMAIALMSLLVIHISIMLDFIWPDQESIAFSIRQVYGVIPYREAKDVTYEKDEWD